VAEPAYRRLQAAADRAQPEVARLVYAALSALAVTAEVRAALARNDLESALHALPVTQLAALATILAPILERLAQQGAEITLTSTPATIAVNLGAPIPRQEIADWARNHAGAMVTAVTDETRFAIRDILVDAVHAGANPRRTAKLLEAVVGLNKRQAAALARYRDSLMAAGVPLRRLDALVARYGARLLRMRATTIARTETITAANRGQLELWRRNVAEGTILWDRWMVEWLAVDDDRECPDCMALDGQRVRIGQPFLSPAYGEVAGPALHPACRCATALVRA
jgi:hypothetical protein